MTNSIRSLNSYASAPWRRVRKRRSTRLKSRCCPMLTDQEKQALERLEAERQRRIAEKIDKGIAVRAPLLVVAVWESIDEEGPRRLSELQNAGETREFHFGVLGESGEPQAIECVCTGVPRAGRDDNYVPAPLPRPTSIPQRYEKIGRLPEKPPVAPASPPVCRRSIRVQPLAPT